MNSGMQPSSSSDDDPKIVITQTRCELSNGVTQTFSSRVVERDEIAKANSVGKAFMGNALYEETSVVTVHVRKPIQFGQRLFGDSRWWCRLNTPERRRAEYLAEKSRGLDLNLGSGVTLEDVCIACEVGRA